MDKNQNLFALLERTARSKNATKAQIAPAWMICKKPYIIPIPGTCRLSRLVENAGAAEVKALDDALDRNGRWRKSFE